MSNFVETTADAVESGFKAITKVRGFMHSITRVPPKFTDSTYGAPKDQIEFVLTDAAILEQKPGTKPIELKESRFSCWIPYAAKGEEATKQSGWVRVTVKSCEEVMGCRVTETVGKLVTIERRPEKLGKSGDKDLISENYWRFVPTDTADSEDTVSYIRDNLVDKNPQAAKRFLMIDERAKQYPEYKDAFDSGVLAEKLGLVVDDDGVFRAGS